MAPPVQQRAWSIPERPLICDRGSRPDNVPYDPYKHGANCSIEDAKRYYAEQANIWSEGVCYSEELCETDDPSVPEHACEDFERFCIAQKISIPVMFTRYGINNIQHPFIEQIAYNLDLHGLQNFRSSKIFDDVARSPQIANLVKDKREITILYPGSGSHISPLLIPLRLIDGGKIDRANLIYTEVNGNGMVNIERYLRFLESPSRGLINGLEKTDLALQGHGSVTRFSFTYKDVPISLYFALNRTHGNAQRYYAPASYLEMADLVIFHDGVRNSADTNEATADNVVNELNRLAAKPGGKTRLLLSEDQWMCDDNADHCKMMSDIDRRITHFDGHYGCQYIYIDDVPRFVAGSNSTIRKIPTKSNVHDSDPDYAREWHRWGAILAEFPTCNPGRQSPVIIRTPARHVQNISDQL